MTNRDRRGIAMIVASFWIMQLYDPRFSDMGPVVDIIYYIATTFLLVAGVLEMFVPDEE